MARTERELAVLEQISMYLTALPCPPLPVLVHRPGAAEEDGGRVGATSSHDLMAGLLLHAMLANDAAFNERRKTKQLAITDRLITALEEARGPDDAYGVCQRFTAEYLQSFEDGCGFAVQFQTADDVDRGSPVHRAFCSWHAAQDIMHPPAEGGARSADVFARMTYLELMQEHLARVVAI